LEFLSASTNYSEKRQPDPRTRALSSRVRVSSRLGPRLCVSSIVTPAENDGGKGSVTVPLAALVRSCALLSGEWISACRSAAAGDRGAEVDGWPDRSASAAQFTSLSTSTGPFTSSASTAFASRSPTRKGVSGRCTRRPVARSTGSAPMMTVRRIAVIVEFATLFAAKSASLALSLAAIDARLIR